MSSIFKLIAVKVEEGCAPYIQKNLEGGWYLFDKDYTIDKDSPKLKKDRQVPDNFFSTEEEQNPSPTINIHAIVGMNGSGKSALIDFILRLINSYACKLVGYKGRKEHDPQVIYKGENNYNKNKPEDLAWIYGVIGKICLDYDGKIYVYTINTSKNNPNIEYITIETIENGKVYPNSNASEPTFYTILLNYSIHSLNTADYSEEQTEGYHWLNGLFHKNDGYKTPCVLTPQRLKGNIDINTENELSKDRLIAIALMNKSKNEASNNIGGGYKLNRLNVSPATWTIDEKEIELKNELLDYHLVENEKEFDSLFGLIKEAWEKKISQQNNIFHENCIYHSTAFLKDACLKYLAYKTISIDYKYIYKNSVFDQQTQSIFSFLHPYRKNLIGSTIDKLIDLVYDDQSHITNKIHQTLEFLKLSGNDWNGKVKDIETKSIKRERKKDIFWKNGEAHNPYPNVLTFTIRTEDLKRSAQNDIKEIYLVPPPIFDVELFVSKDGEKEIPLSKLSSGERQLLYSSSSYLYHLLNLDSAHESQSDRIKYEYVNLICDEIELYFHPEYQRQFVDYMLKSIRSMNLKHIKAINILLSTHSPFILSDIPDAHVLYLKEGKPENRQGETFGANIHELLRDAFFLNGMPIGDFAQKKILKLNEKIEAVTEQTSLEELERLNKEISLIGEPILRRQLLKLLEKRGEHAKSIARVAQLENELNELRQRIEYDQNQSRQ
ncbi:MAG: AAA family ATPase [Porphyromonadaceae bacterium]|nr:AAA family ATPase [Porphyromonadaceae bacterium]